MIDDLVQKGHTELNIKMAINNICFYCTALHCSDGTALQELTLVQHGSIVELLDGNYNGVIIAELLD